MKFSRAKTIILRALRHGEANGEQLREALAAAGAKKGREGFYALMATLESQGDVVARVVEVTYLVNGKKERYAEKRYSAANK